VALRPFNVFRPLLLISRFISLLLKGDQPVIYGDGNGEDERSRDFVFVYSKDVVK